MKEIQREFRPILTEYLMQFSLPSIQLFVGSNVIAKFTLLFSLSSIQLFVGSNVIAKFTLLFGVLEGIKLTYISQHVS